MKTTIKQQIKAVKRAKVIVQGVMLQRGLLPSAILKTNTDLCLKDAASTLAAVDLIGEHKIKCVPDMLATIEYALKNLKWYGDMAAIIKIEEKLTNFKK